MKQKYLIKNNSFIFFALLFLYSCHSNVYNSHKENLCEFAASQNILKHYYCYEGSDSLFLEKWNSLYFDSLYQAAKEYNYFLSAQEGYEVFKDTFKVAIDSFYNSISGTPMVRLYIYSNIYKEDYFLKTRYVIVTLFGPYMKLLSMRGWKYELNNTSKVVKKNGKVGVYFGIDLGPILDSDEYKKFLKKNRCSNISFTDIVKAHNFYVNGYVTDQFD